LKIIGTGSALPEKTVTNDDLAAFLDTSDEWIRPRTGIRSRRVISREKLDALAASAAQAALADAGLDASGVDFILCSNVCGEYMTPGLSCIIQGLIGASCPSLDINAACAGFVYALYTANAFMAASGYDRILIVCAEENSRLVDWADRSTCVLFGDAAAAAVVERSAGKPFFHLRTSSNLDSLFARYAPGNSPYAPDQPPRAFLSMQGSFVFKQAVSTMCGDIRAVLEKSGVSEAEVDLFLLHQANYRIIKTIIDRMGAPEDRFPHNIGNYGNTSSASVPLLLDELKRAGRINRGDKVVFSAFGAGLTSAACYMEWE
jgi:3-oxoacyl-[acyl-carrier-protein] synthase-3